jgi:radical SAM superfamily enzyme YgiQ (UPF0313 family)
MADIVLATLNAKYIHAAFGLRYLLANLGGLQDRAVLAEFDLRQRPVDIAEALLARQPKIIGLGIYVWNVAPSTELVALLKRLRPGMVVVLGGPEVSYETEGQPIVRLADYVIQGEADLKFAEVCQGILGGRPPTPKILAAPFPDFENLALPYALYTDDDIAHRLIYVEASRGCPFRCEFCLSALDIPLRQAPLPALFEQLERLLARGVRQFKFVDRTFNLNRETSHAVLEFLLERYRPGLFCHFEVVPDHFPEALREIIRRFPPGTLQFEVGVQTFTPDVAARIERRQDGARTVANLRFLREQTGVHIHSDLVAGLPGESLESFAAGFDQLVALSPQEIQVGMLKRLRGAPIARHDVAWEMVYSPFPPYEILQNKLIDFATMQRLRRFARYWDLVANSGNFVETAPCLWGNVGQASCLSTEEGNETGSEAGTAGGIGRRPALQSPFHAFLRFSDWLFGQTRRTDGIALVRLMELLAQYLTEELGFESRLVAQALQRDWTRSGRRENPAFLLAAPRHPLAAQRSPEAQLPNRQARHLGQNSRRDR